MVLTAWLAVFLAVGAAQAHSFHGDGTTYGGNPLGGTCGFQRPWRVWTPQSMQLTAALNHPQWKSSLNCGRCVSVKHGDNAPVTIQIVDQCPECKHGDLDFATGAYNVVVQKGPGREKISWDFVECPDTFAAGDLEFVLKEGSNPYWTAFQPQNFKHGIECVDIDVGNGWERLERNEGVLVGFYFLYQRGVHGPFKLRATSVTGQVIVTPTFSSLNDPMRTGQQFGGGYSKHVASVVVTPEAQPTPAPQAESLVVAPIAAVAREPMPPISPPILYEQPAIDAQPFPIATRHEQQPERTHTPTLSPAPAAVPTAPSSPAKHAFKPPHHGREHQKKKKSCE
ncbi:hypothetical protein ATCC90586_003424 [Pythium insidiosum]|nr:hypothetical protein ATCC90586_003424 [Pythium insidiosum]